MQAVGIVESSLRKIRVRAVRAWRERQRRLTNAASDFEILAQSHDFVLFEKQSGGHLCEFSLQRGTVRTRSIRWQDCCEPLFDWIHARLDRWEMRRSIRRRRMDHRRARQDLERRLQPPAFVCRLPGDSLR